ncbi:MAG: hypothetical protein Q4B69_05180 [Slackia sp.]|nr:hypothetical protein [Slackia sp.]
MLLLLTGDVQIGKTRWLQKAVAFLEQAGISCQGVLAPGTWVEKDDGSLDKTGIDNLLLPGHEIVPFARRADIAQKSGCFDAESQAAKAGLKWHISDDAIARVNEHFRMLRTGEAARNQNDERASRVDGKAILFIDELGQLELLRDEGLTEAVSLLAQGPRDAYEHAIVIARDKFGLPEYVEDRFGAIWGGSVRISPDDAAWQTWIEPLVENRA